MCSGAPRSKNSINHLRVVQRQRDTRTVRRPRSRTHRSMDERWRRFPRIDSITAGTREIGISSSSEGGGPSGGDDWEPFGDIVSLWTYLWRCPARCHAPLVAESTTSEGGNRFRAGDAVAGDKPKPNQRRRDTTQASDRAQARAFMHGSCATITDHERPAGPPPGRLPGSAGTSPSSRARARPGLLRGRDCSNSPHPLIVLRATTRSSSQHLDVRAT